MKIFKILFLFCFMFSCNSDLDSGSESEFSSDSGLASGSGEVNGPDTSAGQVTAGEWNDLSNWSFWLDILENEAYTENQTYWDFYTKNRLSFQIVKTNSDPVNGALVALYKNNVLITEAKTDNFGKANLFIDLNVQHNDFKDLSEYGFTVNATLVSQPLLSMSEGINTYVLDTDVSVQDKIEISFIVDATSSMSDELEFLKNDLQDVISSITAANSSSSIFTSTVFYRDAGDDYIVKYSDFTSNANTTIAYIEQQSAAGGGDFPEAVDSALNTAINELQWSEQAKTKIAFLLLDAPPHQESQVISDIHLTLKNATKKGVKIVPITASGIDKPTEFLMRFLAVVTNGTYVFITDDSGIGNDHLEPSVGPYEVELLNELLVRLINQYSE
jgi:hypothetical protein